MRLGVLGPAAFDLAGLARHAQVLVDNFGATKVLYLGPDDAMDVVVASWAEELVGQNPSDRLLFDRAAESCVDADAGQVRAFVQSERARRRLRIFSSLPPAPGRTIELLDGRVVVLLFDKATLDEDDIAGATVFVYGKSEKSLVKRVGPRMFVSPGKIGSENGGALLLDDDDGGVRCRIIDGSGRVTVVDGVGLREVSGKLKVQGPG